MENDPLSAATRTAKRNLLAISLLAITYKAFHVTIENVPIAELNCHFEKEAFTFLLIVCTIYFGLTFALYYWIDIKNHQLSRHQEVTVEKYRKGVEEFRNKTFQAWLSDIRTALPQGWIVGGYERDLQPLLERLEVWPWQDTTPVFSNFDAIIKETKIMKLPSAGETSGLKGQMLVKQDDELYKKLSQISETRLHQYRWESLWQRLLRMPWQLSVKAIYMFRNYVVDGAFPLILALIALASIYNVIDIAWLSTLMPKASAT